MNKKKIIQHNKIWRETTDGETLYQWLFKGAWKLFPAPFFFLNGYRTRLKTGERLPSSSHCPIAYYYNRKLNRIMKSEYMQSELLFFKHPKNTIESKIKYWRYHSFLLGGTI